MIDYSRLSEELFVEPAMPSDIDRIMEIERSSWPETDGAMVAAREKIELRQSLGCLLATKDRGGQIYGYITTFQPEWADPRSLEHVLKRLPTGFDEMPTETRWNYINRNFGIPQNWYEATNDGWIVRNGYNMRKPDGKVVMGASIATAREIQGHGIVRITIQGALKRAEELGAEYFIAFSRLPAYEETERKQGRIIPPEEYKMLTRQRKDGGVVPHDYGFQFHWEAGAQPTTTIDGKRGYVLVPNSMYDDFESKGYGILVITPINPVQRREPFSLLNLHF